MPRKLQRRPVFAAFGGVIEDDVENDLDSRRVECIDHCAEFVPGGVALGVVGVGGLGRAEDDRVVTPEIPQLLAGHRIDELAVVFVEFVDRQQLDGGDSQVGEIVRLLGEAANRCRDSARPSWGRS